MGDRTDDPLAEQRALLHQAKEAAANGEIETMLACLHSSAVLDGLFRYHARINRRTPPSEIEKAIAAAVQALETKAHSGQRIDDPGALLWKVCARRVKDAMRAGLPPVDPWDDDDVPIEPRAVSEDRLQEAVKAARSLLPLIRGERQRQFIEVHLDAIQEGLYFTSDQELADVLGITTEYVQVLRHRAFSRWRRVAQENGLLDQIDPLVEERLTTEQQEDEDHE